MDPSPAPGLSLTRLAAFDPASDQLNVVVETPKGSRNKFKYDDQLCLFRLSSVLPAGASFPFDFGFVPSTLGEDGDPLDVLVLMDEPAFAGCLVPARLIGVVEAEQTESGQTERNDRLIAVAANSRTHRDVRALDDLNVHLLEEIEHFFVSYNAAKDSQFRVVGRQGPERAGHLVAAAQARHQRDRHTGSPR
jgi:inorganic pyrophosphatase